MKKHDLSINQTPSLFFYSFMWLNTSKKYTEHNKARKKKKIFSVKKVKILIVTQ